MLVQFSIQYGKKRNLRIVKIPIAAFKFNQRKMNPLKILIIFLFCSTTFHSSFAQKISKKDLKNTEWFEDNADTICEMFQITLKVGDTLELIKRLNKDLQHDSKLFGKQELAILGHRSYANFIFRPKSSLVYYLTTEDLSVHTIVGLMPFWKWKLTRREEITFYQAGKFQLTLRLVKRDQINFRMDNNNLTTEKLVFVRVK